MLENNRNARSRGIFMRAMARTEAVPATFRLRLLLLDQSAIEPKKSITPITQI
jgi:hypothetical protein